MMRISILGLWYALSTLLSASVAAKKGIEFGVLMTTDDPDDPDRHPSVACEGESAMMQSVLDVTLVDLVTDSDDTHPDGKGNDSQGVRKLHGSSRYCYAFCRTTKPGMCYWIAPQCYPKRRFLKDEARGKDDTDGTNKDKGSADKNKSNKGKVKNVQSSDSTEDDMADFVPVHTAQCAQAILAVDDKLVLLAGMVSTQECKEALLDVKTYRCYKER